MDKVDSMCLWALLIMHISMVGYIGYYFNKKYHAETQALILEYQSKLTAVETEKQKTIYEFLDSLNKSVENRDGSR